MSAGAPIVLGYYPAWDAGLPPDRIGFGLFTHLAHAFASPTPEGGVAGIDLAKARAFTTPARAAEVMPILSLGGGGAGSDHFAAIMADPVKADRWIGESVALTEAGGYAGIDCDWEFPSNPVDAANLVKLVAAYRKRLPRTLLTMAVNASDWNGRWFDHVALLPLFDFLNVMTYDFHGPWGDHAGHNAPLHPTPGDPDGATMNSAAGMAYWHERKGFPRDKLCLGIPCYGRSFLAPRWHEPVSGPSTRSYLGFRAMADLLADGWRREWDATAGVPYLAKDRVNELISYEDEESAALKGKWARDHGYRGIFFWEVTQDAVEGTHRIVAAARTAFLTK